MSLLSQRKVGTAMSMTLLSKEDALAGRRSPVTRYERFCKELAERIDACAGTLMAIRIDLRGLEPREIDRARRYCRGKNWKTRIVSDQNDGKRFLLLG